MTRDAGLIVPIAIEQNPALLLEDVMVAMRIECAVRKSPFIWWVLGLKNQVTGITSGARRRA